MNVAIKLREKMSARTYFPVWNKKETYNKLSILERLVLSHDPLNYIAPYKNMR